MSAFALAVAAPAEPSPREAKSHYATGIAAYGAQDWPTAIRELKLAWQQERRPEYLFALAQSQRLSGDCQSAVASYRAFLGLASSRQAAIVEGLIQTCAPKSTQPSDDQEETNAEAQPTPSIAEDPPAPSAVEKAPREEASPRASLRTAAPGPLRWYHDAVGDTLALASVAAAALGTTFLVLGNGAMSRAGTDATYGGYLGAVGRAKTQQLVGLAALAASLACGVGAIWRYGTLGPAMAVTPQAGGAVFSLSGFF